MHKVTITFYSDKSPNEISDTLIDLANSDLIQSITPCKDKNNKEINTINYSIDKEGKWQKNLIV